MAVTKLWKINTNLKKTLDYAEDKNKTMSNLKNAIDYAENKDKTEQSYYVTGINCDVDYAIEQMIQTKECFNKLDGILGYHGYQSFKEGEVTPEQAHKIGVELANEMWGDKYQVIVTTHLNTNHYHNHFIVNSVSFVDGEKFNSCRETTAQLRYLNDSICKENGLSSLEEKPTPNSKMDFSYYLNSDREKKNNYYETAKRDIDIAICRSKSLDDFKNILRSMNYELIDRYGKYSIRNMNYKRNIRIERKFGEEYSVENINHRILETTENDLPIIDENSKYYFNRKKHKLKSHGIVALYRYYCYLLGMYHKNNNTKFTKDMYDDLSKLNQYSSVIRMFDKENINTDDDFKAFEERINGMYDELICQRKQLRKQYDRTYNENEKDRIIDKIKDINSKLKEIKSDVDVCTSVEISSNTIEEKVEDYEKTKVDMDKFLG
jgi:hypothetical protein